MALTVICCLLLYLSYKRKNGTKYMYASMILAILRSSIRLIDFEKTRELQTVFMWDLLFQNQLIGTIIYLMVMIFMFGNVKYNNVILPFCFLFTIGCAYYSLIVETDSFNIVQTLMHLPM